jgi:hypothetical protein
MIPNSRFIRCIKGMSTGAILGTGVMMLIGWGFKLDLSVNQVLPGAMAGAAAGFMPAVLLPRGFPLPSQLTTIWPLGITGFFFWLVANGVVKGEVLSMARRGQHLATVSIRGTISWQDYPGEFVLQCLIHTGLGVLVAGLSVFYCMQAVIDAPVPPSASPFEQKIVAAFNKWKDSPASFHAVFVFTIALSSILVVLYLLLLFGPRPTE